MIRSGSTLHFQLAARLVEETGLGKRVEWVKPECFPELREKYSDYDGWKVFKSHQYTEAMAAEFTRHEAKGIYIFRDIRDVVVSLMQKEQKAFFDLQPVRIVRNNLDNFQKWTALEDVMVSKYEDVMVDLPGEVARIAAHLGLAVDRTTCDQIAAQYSLDRQKERIEHAVSEGRVQEAFAEGPLFDPQTLLHTNHIATGAVGGWRDTLSHEQIALVEDMARDWLVQQGYELKFNFVQRKALRNLRRMKIAPRVARRKLLKKLTKLGHH